MTSNEALTSGRIVLIPFPFAELTNVKVRPAVIVTNTRDKYKDLILCAISSVVPSVLGEFEILLPQSPVNRLRIASLLKVDRIVTLKRADVISTLGTLDSQQLDAFKIAIRRLVA